MLFVTLLQNAICPKSLSNANLLRVIADKISRVLKTSGVTQDVLLDISKTFYKFKLFGLMKNYFILLRHFVVLKDFQLF